MRVAGAMQQHRLLHLGASQFHIDDVDQHQGRLAGVHAALEHLDPDDILSSHRQGFMHQRVEVLGVVVKRQLEFGQANHGGRLALVLAALQVGRNPSIER